MVDSQYDQARDILRIGLGVTCAAALLGLLSAPFLVVAAVSFIVTWLLLAVVYGRATRRWRWTWTIAVASAAWVFATVLTIDLWGIGYDLSEAYRPVPASLEGEIGITALFGLTALIVLLSSGIVVAGRLRRRRLLSKEVF